MNNLVQYPVFVYGTLRPGFHNYEAFLAGRTVHIDYNVKVPGFIMLAGPSSPFPFVVPGNPENVVTGDLVYVAPGMYDNVLMELDYLEGYIPGDEDNLYDRKLIQFDADGVARVAYIYLAAASQAEYLLNTRPLLVSGDWNNRLSLN